MKKSVSIDQVVNALFVLSSIIVVCHDIWWSGLPEILDGGSELLTSAYNLSMGYVVSFIFYLLVVRYKEYRDSIYVNKVILPFIEQVIESSNLVNECIINDASIKKADTNLTKSKLNALNYNDYIPRIAKTFLYSATTWDVFLIQEKHRSQKNIKRLFEFVAHLEPELIETVTRLDSCSYYISLVFVNRYTDDMKCNSLEELADALVEHNKIIDELKVFVDKRKAS
ncbi:hypothetical protein [Vibrio cyclitrophicus]|uniref:hypothetical protein n=1 Tax=Vibrio cyclitrophicus TaxID=47951 RepID=UPI0003128567|nr:hypothetical protein [Vibrio cyclitrophicus]ERM60866.1 hypothetical protein M565_ctg1P1058 [Vibrio cyclitrophicus FF75]OEE49741.1 hypothetical protein OAG_07575 [Vibrio cyclitrophicus FF75]